RTAGTLLLRGIASNPKGIVLPGLYARVRVPVGEKKDALLVPVAALGFDQQGPYVLVVGEKNVVARRAVTLGTEVDGFRVIAEGLEGQELVVVEGVIKAIPGRPVQPEKIELKPLPAKTKPKPRMAVKKKGRS
ncbi:MAG: efflux RND transporter periplasmic adaptor subunit, partial [Syntrophales bacterium]|nr:efflux RND transporter periplasmic adaptor subunit [Syntrophales bacterium]